MQVPLGISNSSIFVMWVGLDDPSETYLEYK